jgi:hypothetical protein
MHILRTFLTHLHSKKRPACNNVDEIKLEQYGQRNIVQACFHIHQKQKIALQIVENIASVNKPLQEPLLYLFKLVSWVLHEVLVPYLYPNR